MQTGIYTPGKGLLMVGSGEGDRGGGAVCTWWNNLIKRIKGTGAYLNIVQPENSHTQTMEQGQGLQG